MHEFLLNIDNKEILNEILHLSIDFLIGNCDDVSTINKSSHKYGFSDPDDFHSALQTLAHLYKTFCLRNITETELLSNFAHMTPDLQQYVLEVFKARQLDIVDFLVREHNSKTEKLLKSFDWDIRMIMGESSLLTRRRLLTTVTLNCLEPDGDKSQIHFQMNNKKLNELIEIAEKCIADLESKKLDDIIGMAEMSLAHLQSANEEKHAEVKN